jgi:lysyl-tRNA synthetase class 2
MAERVEPHLGLGRPHFLYDFPLELKALARVRRGTGGAPDVAERFEVFVEGVELANGYHELTDAAEQRDRFLAENALRRELGRSEAPIDARMLEALESGLSPCAGVALGFDRLVMVALGVKDIRAVVSFTHERA